MKTVFILLLVRQFFLIPKHLKSQPWTCYLDNPRLFNGSPSLYPTTSPELNNNKIWFLSIETETHSENFCCRVFLKSHVVNFARSVATRVLFPLLYSTCLIFLLNIFWAIQQEMFFMSFLKKICQTQKKKIVMKYH